MEKANAKTLIAASLLHLRNTKLANGLGSSEVEAIWKYKQIKDSHVGYGKTSDLLLVFIELHPVEF